jgi:hypothetical protein
VLGTDIASSKTSRSDLLKRMVVVGDAWRKRAGRFQTLA